MTGNNPKLAGVIGWPIAHSLSPLIHTIWAERNRIHGYYIPFAVPPSFDDFSTGMKSLAVLGFKGVNVTLPHKENALKFASDASDNAKKAGAANMLTFSSNGVYADNSDILGFEYALDEQSLDGGAGKSALILGAGGASRAIAIALKNKGYSKILVTNRTREKAEHIAQEFTLSVVAWEDRSALIPSTDLIVNTTSLGMTGEPLLELDFNQLKKETAVADIVYAPLQTKLLKEAAERGCKIIDGLSMLMHQAAPGFQQWFSGEAVVDKKLRNALIAALERKKKE